MSKTTPPPHILVVDDEPTIRTVLRATLEAHGFLASEAGNGQEGLRLMDTIAFDLVLLDYNMPIADGVTVLQELQKRDHPPRVVMLTAYGSVALATRVIRLGAVDFLEKPIVPDDLVACVNNALAGRPVPPAPPASFEVAGVDRRDPAQVQAAIRRALVARQTDAAETLLQQLVDAFPPLAGHASVLNLKGVINELRGRYLAARALYRMALSADASREYLPSALNAWRLYDQLSGRQPDSTALVIGNAAENRTAFGEVDQCLAVPMGHQATFLPAFNLTPPPGVRPTSKRG